MDSTTLARSSTFLQARGPHGFLLHHVVWRGRNTCWDPEDRCYLRACLGFGEPLHKPYIASRGIAMTNVFYGRRQEIKARWSRPVLERKEVKVITNGSTCEGCDVGAAG